MPITDSKGSSKLSEYDLRLVAFIEEYFWNTGASPPVVKIVEALDIDEKRVTETLKHPTIHEYLNSRSVNNPLDELIKSDGLTAHQLFTANILLNIQDKQSLREKLKAANCSVMQYYAWLADDRFSGYIQRRCEQVFNRSKWQVDQSLLDNATNGDTGAQRLYYELTGKLSRDINVNFNVEGLLSQVVEIVSNAIGSHTNHQLAGEIMLEISSGIEYLIQTGQAPQAKELISTTARELASGQS